MHYHVAAGMSGYLSDTDDETAYPSFAEAVAVARDLLRCYRDDNDDVPASERRTWHRHAYGSGHALWYGSRRSPHDIPRYIEVAPCAFACEPQRWDDDRRVLLPPIPAGTE